MRRKKSVQHKLFYKKKEILENHKTITLSCMIVLCFLVIPCFVIAVIWAASWQNQQCGCAPSEDWDQPGHQPSLIRVFAVRMKKVWVLSYPLSAQRRLWSDWVDAQADLSLRWAHTHFVGFVTRQLKLNFLYYRLVEMKREIGDHRPWRGYWASIRGPHCAALCSSS